MTDVVRKTNTKGNADYPQGPAFGVHQRDKVRTITNAELRWVFRNKVFPQTRELVQFWLNDAPCLPPWDAPEGYRIWAEYAPRGSASRVGGATELD